MPSSDDTQPQGVTLLRAQGVLFDSDGVLVDSDAAVIDAWSRWAIAFGLDVARVLSMVHGHRSVDTVRALLPSHDVAPALDRINATELAAASMVTALPGAHRLVDAIPEDRWAVVTSGTKPLAVARLEAAGFPVPRVIVTADDVVAGKPQPDSYLLGARKIGIEPRECVVVEDSLNGIHAARAAGVASVLGIGGRAPLDSVDARVADLTAVRWTGIGLAIPWHVMLRS